MTHAYGPPTVDDIATDLFVNYPRLSVVAVVCMVIVVGWLIQGALTAMAEIASWAIEAIGRRWPHLASPELRRRIERERRTAVRVSTQRDRAALQLAAVMTLLRLARR